MTAFTYGLLALALVYAGAVCWLAYRESGEKSMLFLPQWVDASSGVSRPPRRNGLAAFALLSVAMIMFFSLLQ